MKTTLKFLSTPSARRATFSQFSTSRSFSDFYPRPPRGGRQRYLIGGELYTAISIHVLREEGDRCTGCLISSTSNFYPRPPRGGRPLAMHCFSTPLHFYPRPPRGGRPLAPCCCPRRSGYFYPRPPRGGRRIAWKPRRAKTIFLSTSSARRATARPPFLHRTSGNFYPRPPRGGRHTETTGLDPQYDISIHVLREEGDLEYFAKTANALISIHVLREEGDWVGTFFKKD